MHEVPPTQAVRPRTPAGRKADKARSQRMQERGDQPGRSIHTARLNVDQFRSLMALRLGDNPGVVRMARNLKLGVGTVHNALAGQPINGPFIAALLKASKGKGYSFRLEDLVIADTEQAAA